MWHRCNERDGEAEEERAVLQHAVRAEAEEERADAEEERDAVGDDDEHPRIAVIRLEFEAARGAALVRRDPALEQRPLAAARAAAAESAKNGGPESGRHTSVKRREKGDDSATGQLAFSSEGGNSSLEPSG